MFNKIKRSLIKFRLENFGLGTLLIRVMFIHILQISGFYSKPKIHVIGDSHVLSLVNKNFSIHYLGSVTAHNINSDSSKTHSREKFLNEIKKIKNKDLIITVFGEIDSRIHFYHQYMKQNKKVPLKRLIKKTTKNYTGFVKHLMNKNYNVAIYNVIPPGEQPNIYDYEFYADRETMVKITKEFNKQLKNWSAKNKVLFIDIYNSLVDKNGKRLKKYKLDRIHLNPKVSLLVLTFLLKNTTTYV